MPTILAASLLASLAAPKIDPDLRAEVEARIPIVQAWAADPIVVESVREANRHLRSERDIARIDEAWVATRGVDDFMRAIIDHPAAQRLRELRGAHPELQEVFVTDRLGANVASTNKTSDFYQGDEDKFREAFAGGEGSVHIGDLTRDESIQSYAIPIGVPVLDEGVAIGVLVVTVNVEKVKRSASP